jgi:zinc transporter 1/2/3
MLLIETYAHSMLWFNGAEETGPGPDPATTPLIPANLDHAEKGSADDHAASAHPANTSHGHHSHCGAAHVHAASREGGSGGSSLSKVTAWMTELGCLFHSVIIGVEVGILRDSWSKTSSLIIALVFHQMIEGLGLSSIIASAGFSRSKAFLMVLAYSTTTPLGIAIGIAIDSSYNPESRAALITQGTLDAVSGGLLLYIGVVHLIFPDFCSSPRMPSQHRLGMYTALVLSAGAMCGLAAWA